MMRIFSKFSGNAGESGRSMVEMLGVLAIIGVLSIGGTAGYLYAMNKHHANEIIQGVKERAVIGSGQRINDHEVDFHEFPELIIDYTTSGRNTGLNGEKEFFSVDVADVPQAVCQNVLNMNWDWPSGVFVNGVREETCPTENSQMTFVFAADLSSKIAQEQDPCYGSTNSCCISVGRNAYYGERSDIYDCKGAGEKICCNKTGVDQCIYPQDANYTKWKDNAVKGLDPTCTKHSNQFCDVDLNCQCGACPNTNMVYDALCNCLCPVGYQDTACGSGKYAAATLKNASGGTVCYKCQACPTDQTPPVNKCSVARTEAGQNGCPSRRVYDEVPCACDSGYTTNACVPGTTYQVGMKTLTDGTQCYKCARCPGDATPPANKCSVARTEAGQNGCPSRTVYDEVPCACDSGYTTNACVPGTTYQVDMKTLTDGTQCYKCAGCPGDETLLAGKCGKAKIEEGQNGCPDRTVYTDIVDMGDCGKCQNGQVVADTSKYNTSCQTCTAENAWMKKNKKDGTVIGECGKCKNGVIIENQKDGTVCGTCGKCDNGICAGDYTATTTVKKYGGNNTACCQNTTVSYCPLRGKPADECTGDKVQEFWTNCTEGGGRSEKHGNYSHHVTNLCTNERSVKMYRCYGGKPTNGPKANCKTNVHTGAVTCK